MIPFGKINPLKLFTDNLYAISLYSRQISGTVILFIIAHYLSVNDYVTFNTIAIINIVYSICLSLITILAYILKLSLAKFLILNIILGAIIFIQCSYYTKINYFVVINHIKRFIKMINKSNLCVNKIYNGKFRFKKKET